MKSTLQREFDVSVVLEALKERGEIVTKIAYANWGRMENSTRQLSEYAVQMVQRDPSPRGDKNGADINLALDALEMAFTHDHINAFCIVSGDSDFIALVNKLKQYDKTVFVVGGKAFTSTILQKNCHEFISYESMLDDSRAVAPQQQHAPQQQPQQRPDRQETAARRPPASVASRRREAASGGQNGSAAEPPAGSRSASGHAAGGARAAGSRAPRSPAAAGPAEIDHAAARFELQRAGLRRGLVHRLHRAAAQSRPDSGHRRRRPLHDPAQAQRRAGKDGEAGRRRCRPCATCSKITGWKSKTASRSDELLGWVKEESPAFDWKNFGFQEFSEFLNYAQDKTVVRIVPDETSGLTVFLGAEFHPPAVPEPEPLPLPEETEEIEEPQPVVPGQPTAGSPRVKKGAKKVAGGPEINGNVVAPPKRARKSSGTPRKRKAPAPGRIVAQGGA